MWETTTVGEICQIMTGKKDVNTGNPNGKYPFFTCAKENTFSDEYSFDTEALLIAGNGDVGRVSYYKGKFEAYQRTYVLDKFDKILPRFLYHILQTELPIELDKQKQGTAIPYIRVGMLEDFEIPLPPLLEQEKIVTKLNRIFSGITEAVEAIKAKQKEFEFLKFSIFRDCLGHNKNSSWKIFELKNFCSIQNGYGFSPKDMIDVEKDDYLPVIKIGNLGKDAKIDTNYKYHEYADKLKRFLLHEGDLVVAMTGATVGKVSLIPNGTFLLNQRVGKIVLESEKISMKFIEFLIRDNEFYSYCQKTATGGGQGNISGSQILEFKIPFPPIEEQEKIVDKLNKASVEIKEIESIYQHQINELQNLKVAFLRQELQSEVT